MNRRDLIVWAAFVLLMGTLVSILTFTVTATAATRIAESCHVNGRVTTVTWSDGTTSRHRDLTTRTRLFPGNKTMWDSPRRKGERTVIRCHVTSEGFVLIRDERRARYGFRQPVRSVTEPPTPVTPPPPPPPPPALVGTWKVAPVLYATVDASWQVEAAAEVWNRALPADRQITVTTTPCRRIVNPGCIPVEVYDFENDPSWEWPVPGGAAWQQFHEGTMHDCAIGLSETANLFEGRPYVTAHEVGHCLGLPHWEGAGSHSVMSTNGASMTWVTDADLAWLSAGYAS